MTQMTWPLRRIGAICIICGLIGLPPLLGSSAGGASWSFAESFRNGISGWISYPLAQDEGYDPSLYTQNRGGVPALVRDVTAYGQKILRVGLLRPLQFHASPSAVLELRYTLETCGSVTGVRMKLAAASGQEYIAAMPSSPGEHTVQLTGQQFSLPAKGAEVQAVIVEAEIANPLPGSHNRLTLRSFEVEAERPKTPALDAPPLEISRGSGVAVAEGVSSGPISFDVKRRGSGNVERDLRSLVLAKIPPHPRILLTAVRLEQLKSMTGASALASIISGNAARLRSEIAYNPQAGENIALLSPVSVFPGLPQYGHLLDAYANAIAFNALDYRLSGNVQALAAARKALLTVAQWPTWTPPWFLSHGLHTYYQVGVFTQSVAVGYDLIADALSPAEKSRIAQAFWGNSIRPTLQEYFFNNRLPTASSNHMANSVGGAIAACAALWGDVPDWNSRYAPALAELIASYESLLQGLFPGDGSEAEPAGYEDFAMEGMSFGAAALQSLGIHPRGMGKMLHSFWWLRYAQFAPGQFLDTGDFSGNLSSLSGYAWSAENAGDPALQSFYESAKNGTLMDVIRLARAAAAAGLSRQPGERQLKAASTPEIEALSSGDAPALLDLVCCTHPRTAVPAPPLARIFPLRGSAVMRSGWAPGSTVISLRVGPWFNHEHHDQGSFQAAAWGEELIAEAGYADYYKDPQYADYFSQAPGHNSVIVDADPFSQEDYDGRYWPALHQYPKFQGHVFSQALDFLSADLKPAYNDEEKLDEYVREYVFIKPDVLIVHDRLRAPLAHRYTSFLHIPPGDSVRIDGPQAIIQGKAAFALLTAGGSTLKWMIEPAPAPENAYTDLDRHNVLPRETLRLDSPLTAAADFGVAMQFQAKTQNPVPLASFKTISGFGYKSAEDKIVVLFRTAPGMLVSPNAPSGGVSSDGEAVAISRHNGVEDVLAVEASELRLAGRLLFNVRSSKADVILHQDANGEEVHLDCMKEANLEVSASRNPAAVTLDGASIPLRASNGFVSAPQLRRGGHVVKIRY